MSSAEPRVLRAGDRAGDSIWVLFCFWKQKKYEKGDISVFVGIKPFLSVSCMCRMCRASSRASRIAREIAGNANGGQKRSGLMAPDALDKRSDPGVRTVSVVMPVRPRMSVR